MYNAKNNSIQPLKSKIIHMCHLNLNKYFHHKSPQMQPQINLNKKKRSLRTFESIKKLFLGWDENKQNKNSFECSISSTKKNFFLKIFFVLFVYISLDFE